MRYFSSLLIFTVSLLIFGFRSSFVEDTAPVPCNDADVPRYAAMYITSAPKIDGKPDDEVWLHAPKSTAFRDLIHGTTTHLDTRAAVVWDDEFLYVAFWIEEPDVQARLTERDAPVYQDNDIELFIAGTDGYYEFEMNANATIYEVLFFWRSEFERKGYAQIPGLDPKAALAKSFNGVGFKQHPRGPRIGFWNWDFPGLQKAVHVDGTLNHADDRDKGWTAEISLPWKGLELLAIGDGRSLPPVTGDTWRMDFSRFNTYKASDDDSGGWAWSPHGVWDSHVPECFTYVTFSK